MSSRTSPRVRNASTQSMTTDTQNADAELRPANRTVLAWRGIAPIVAALDAGGVLGAAVVSSAIYYSFAYGEPFWHSGDFNFELTVALFYVLVRSLRGDYAYATYTSARSYFGRICQAWFLAFLALLAAVFLLKVGNHYSRGMAFSLFVAGPVALAMQQRLLALWFTSACRNGRLAVRRVFVVGDRKDVADFCLATDRGGSGHAIVGAFVLQDGPDPVIESKLLGQAVARARTGSRRHPRCSAPRPVCEDPGRRGGLQGHAGGYPAWC